MRRVLAGVALALTLAGPALAQPWAPIPPPRYEVVPPPPGTAYIWRPGHWQWNGVQYVWMPGQYVLRRAGWSRWIPGHWAYRFGRPVWIPPHWG